MGYFALAACLVGAGLVMLTLKKEAPAAEPADALAVEEEQHIQA